MNKKYIVGGAILIIGILLVSYFFYYKSATNSIEKTPEKISTDPEIKNPIDFFYKNFSTKNYHVKMIGKTPDENLGFYYEKGAIVRVDKESKYDKSTFIIKNGKLYTISDERKSFVEMSATDPKSTYILSLYKVASILDPIIQGETPTATPWTILPQKSDNKDILEYQTIGRKFISYLPGNADLMDIKITLDSGKALITSVTMKSTKDTNWNSMNFQYEEINNIESIKNFPMDYKKVDPI